MRATNLVISLLTALLIGLSFTPTASANACEGGGLGSQHVPGVGGVAPLANGGAWVCVGDRESIGVTYETPNDIGLVITVENCIDDGTGNEQCTDWVEPIGYYTYVEDGTRYHCFEGLDLDNCPQT